MAQPEQYYNFRKIAEGGLSRAKTDSASKYPAPCTFTYKGVTANDWHTNKGITWVTFKAIAPSVGINPTCENFFNMTNEQWQKIFNEIWRRTGAYDIQNTALANLVFQSAWGSGFGGALSYLPNWIKEYAGVKPGNFSAIAQTINTIANTPQSAKDFFNFLWSKRKNYLISLNQPANLPGWLNSWDKFKTFNLQYLTDTPQAVTNDLVKINFFQKNRKKILVGGTLTALSLTALILFLRNKRKKKKQTK